MDIGMLGKNGIRILEAIAESPTPITRYKIGDDTGLGRQQVKNDIKKLRKMEMVQAYWIRKKKWKKAKMFWQLAPRGFALLMRKNPRRHDVDIAHQKKFTPILSKKWGYFEKRGVDDLANDALADAADRYLRNRDEVGVKDAHGPIGLLTILEEYFLLYADPRGRLMWAIRDDNELKRAFQFALEKVKTYQESWIQTRQDALKGLRPILPKQVKRGHMEILTGPARVNPLTGRPVYVWHVKRTHSRGTGNR
jgi:DNA-binding transcriptional ArsR family regulator